MDSASGQSVTTCASELSVMVGGWYCGDVGCCCCCRVFFFFDASEEVYTKAAEAKSSAHRTAEVRFLEGMSDSLIVFWRIPGHRLNQNRRAHNGILTTDGNYQSRPSSTPRPRKTPTLAAFL